MHGDGLGRRVCNSPASPILANELHTRHPIPLAVPSLRPMFHAGSRCKDPVGKAFSNASIGWPAQGKQAKKLCRPEPMAVMIKKYPCIALSIPG
jgi:hypothetical protein